MIAATGAFIYALVMPRFVGPRNRCLVAALLGVCCTLVVLMAPVYGQQPTIIYVYDDVNRLNAVVDAQGNVAIYTYDAVGNILRIDRSNASAIPGPVGITFVSPNQGRVDTVVQIFGKGFSATASQNTVTFNGTAALVTAAAPNRLVTKVPAGATTGLIRVTTPLGAGNSPTPFRVIGVLTLDPPGDVVRITTTRQFAATDSGNPGINFSWSVNGIAGGNSTVGTVTSTGLYTAPATVPNPPVVTLTATEGASDPDANASGQVFIVATALQVLKTARSVSVQVTLPPTPPQPATPSASPVSVQVQPPPPPASSATTAAAPASVRVEPPPPAPSSATNSAAGVAVSVEPFISAVAPSSAAPGSNVTITLTGAGFAGANGVTFFRNNSVDGAITVTSLPVNGDGTQATVTISIASGTPTGGRVVQISTPDGASTMGSTGQNVFTVQ